MTMPSHAEVVKGMDAARLPPGQRETKDFPVLDLGIRPTFDADGWRLRVWGAVDHEFTLDADDFAALPHADVTADFHCVTRWSRLGLDWSGVPAREVLARVRPRPDAVAVMAHGMEGYMTNILLDDFDDEDVLLADRLQGRPVPRDHGGPVRLLVPKLYGWKSCKFLVGLEFLAKNEGGFWEQRGYHLRGSAADEQRFW
jgi:DMSO/TMAO reductase YedYZ molybdopterin-dependent catalytic subunit